MNRTTDEVHAERITLKAADGYPLAATRFTADHPAKANLVIAGGIGIPQGFYRNFAEYACRNGFPTMTLDYRGIGDSKPATLKGFSATTIDWATLDLAAAVERMKDESLPLYMVGHSYGGHTLGMLPNHRLVEKFYTFAISTGWTGWMPMAERIRVRILFNVAAPLIEKTMGYMAWKWMGMGEDLPLEAYRQWRRWCGMPHYFFDDPEMDGITSLYGNVTIPIIAANSLDDRWAMPASRDAFLKGYRNASIETRDIDPSMFGREIGHMGYFRTFAKPLWDDVLEWFMKPLDGCGRG